MSARPGRASLVARFLVLGAAAFGLKTAVFGPPRAVHALLVEVPASATPADRARAADEAVLLDLAERADLPRIDAVVREQVVRRLAVVEDVSDSNAAVARGLALGLHRQDPLARERLLADARELLIANDPPAPPSDDEARTWLAAHPETYAAPARVRFKQLFLSRQKRGAGLEEDAAALGRRLAAGEDIGEVDAWAWTSPSSRYTEARLAALAGAGFGEQVFGAPGGAWIGPVASSFGLHFVWVLEHTAGAPAPEALTLPRVRADLAAQATERARAERLSKARQGYRIAWVAR